MSTPKKSTQKTTPRVVTKSTEPETKALTPAEQAEDDALLKEFNENRKTNQNKTNSIFVDNKKLLDSNTINPDFGKLFAVSYDESGNEIKEEIDIKTAQFFPARFRTQVVCKDRDETTKKANYWAREVDEFAEIQLRNGETGEIVFEGEYRDAKEKYNLTMKSVVYVAYHGKVYRWRISGASFDTWFKVKNAIDKNNRPMTFKVKAINPQQNEAVHYNEIEFELGEELFGTALKAAVDIVKEVDEGIAAYFQKTVDAEEKKDSLDDIAGELEDGEKEEEIDIRDLPF